MKYFNLKYKINLDRYLNKVNTLDIKLRKQ